MMDSLETVALLFLCMCAITYAAVFAVLAIAVYRRQVTSFGGAGGGPEGPGGIIPAGERPMSDQSDPSPGELELRRRALWSLLQALGWALFSLAATAPLLLACLARQGLVEAPRWLWAVGVIVIGAFTSFALPGMVRRLQAMTKDIQELEKSLQGKRPDQNTDLIVLGLNSQQPMVTADDAVLAIRHAVQEHGDEDYRLGEPASVENMNWFGKLLGWAWPPSYLGVLRKHNGVWVKGAIILSFLESIDLFLIFHQAWYKPNAFWPVAHDECGNYFVLSIDELGATGECPVVFLEYGSENRGIVGRCYAEFVVNHLAQECVSHGCKSPIHRTGFKSQLED